MDSGSGKDAPRPEETKRSSLRGYVFARFGLLAVVALVALGHVLGYSHYRESREVLHQRLENRAMTIAQLIDVYLTEHETAVAMLGSELAMLPAADVNERTDRLERFRLRYPGVRSALIADSAGTLIGASPSTDKGGGSVLGQSVADRPYFKAIMAGADSHVSDAFVGRGFGTGPIVAVSAPIVVDEASGVAGIVEASLALERFARFKRNLVGIQDALFVIVDGAGLVAYSSSPEYAVLSRFEESAGFPLERSRSGVVDEADIRGTTHFVADKRTTRGWTVLIMQPRAVIIGDSLRHIYSAAIWILAAIAMTLLLSHLVARNITHPLEGLAAGTRRLLAGDDHTGLEALAASRMPREIAALVRDFGIMTRQLGDSRKNLEATNRQLEGALDMARAGSHAKTAFLARMSHELRTPLTAILGFAGILEARSSRSNEANASLVGNIRGAGTKMLTLVDQLLELAQFESGRSGVQPEQAPLPPIVTEALARVAEAIPESEGRIELTVADDLGSGFVDRELLLRAVVSAVSGVSRLASDGRIGMSALRDVADGMEWLTIRMSISSTFDPTQIAAFLDPFWHDEQLGVRRFSDLNLDILIASRYCEMMGGALLVSSDHPSGTVFKLKVPAVYEIPAAVASV